MTDLSQVFPYPVAYQFYLLIVYMYCTVGTVRGAEAGGAGAGRQGHQHEQHTLGGAAA